jgi:hypothetical protein
MYRVICEFAARSVAVTLRGTSPWPKGVPVRVSGGLTFAELFVLNTYRKHAS